MVYHDRAKSERLDGYKIGYNILMNNFNLNMVFWFFTYNDWHKTPIIIDESILLLSELFSPII